MLVVVMLVLMVDILLIIATARLLGAALHPGRILAAAGVDMAFAVLSSAPYFPFLHQFLARLLILLLSGVTAFGFSSGAVVFALLNLSLGGIADSQSRILPTLLGTAGLIFACVILGKERRYVRVELQHGSEVIILRALRDTGNALRDPITGKPVLILSAEIAQKLTGLTPAALRDPVGTLGTVPGLRLIPYQTVGNNGFLLALQIQQAKIGKKQGSVLVALSPQILDNNYQALAGGIL